MSSETPTPQESPTPATPTTPAPTPSIPASEPAPAAPIIVTTSAPASTAKSVSPWRSCLGRAFIALAIIVVIVAAFGAGGAYLFVQHTLPQTSGTLTVAGLHGTVSVARDQYGVPHISGTDLHDVEFAQGYVTAQDRLFQMEFNRRVAQGRLAEFFGAGDDNSLVEADEFLRTLDMYSAAKTEYAMLDDRTRTMLDAYADGVNAFISTHGNSLPLEFTLLGATPVPWTPQDSLAYGRVVAFSLDTTWYTKLARALVGTKVSAATLQELFPDYPVANPTLFLAPGQAAPITTVPGAPTGQTPTGGGASSYVSPALTASDVPDLLKGAAVVHAMLGNIADSIGSNDWVVDGTRTASGKPLLANDPHLGIAEPATWYEVALRGGGLDVIGFSFAGVPGVVIGHNANIAWGVTNVGADNTDLYTETLDPVNHPNQYEYDGQWLPMTVTTATINVKDSKPVTLTIRKTRHGPLLNDVVSDLKGQQPMALQWTALQPGYSFRGFFELDFASNWDTFLQAIYDISISQNFVYADTDGNIGYRMSGELPIRPDANHFVPVPGNTSATDWQGYVSQTDMPTLFNPPTHIIATANNRIMPTSYPVYVTSDWDGGYRARRIDDLLAAAGSGITPDDYIRIQNDVYSIPASKLVPLYQQAASGATGDAAAALKLLDGWDYQATTQSVATTVFEVTTGTLFRELVEPRLGKDTYDFYQSNTDASTKYATLINLLETPDGTLLADDTARNAAVKQALADAMAQLRQALGSDTSKWQWGTLHQADFSHPLTAAPYGIGRAYSLDPVARPGDGATVDVGGSGGITADQPTYDQRTIPSMREIIDLSNFDNSLWIITTGESGQPFSAHYGDLLPLWASGKYQPMTYSAQAIAAANTQLLILKGQ